MKAKPMTPTKTSAEALALASKAPQFCSGAFAKQTMRDEIEQYAHCIDQHTAAAQAADKATIARLREALQFASNIRIIANDNGAWDGQHRTGMRTNGPVRYWAGIECTSGVKAHALVKLLNELATADAKGGL